LVIATFAQGKATAENVTEEAILFPTQTNMAKEKTINP
jgi:hypothetical protein